MIRVAQKCAGGEYTFKPRPVTANFESSVQGPYATGLASANQFGPSMRFVIGADHTARRMAGAMGVRAGSAAGIRRSQWNSVPND